MIFVATFRRRAHQIRVVTWTGELRRPLPRARVVVSMRAAYILLAFLALFACAPLASAAKPPRQPFVLGATSPSEVELEAPAPHGCAAHATETACHAPCVWCTSAAVPSACYGPKAAARLPPAVFECK